MVAYLNRRHRLDELVEMIQQSRPDILLADQNGSQEEKSVAAELFDAIIWTSAKRDMLHADGIKPRRQIVRTLADIYTSIAIALQQEEIIRAKPNEQDNLVRRALTKTKTLLIVDNLETVDDESAVTFLRELPIPSKAIITTRHRIDVAFAIRLKGMDWEEAQSFIHNECLQRNLKFENDDTARLLFAHTGGLPLGLTWSIAQIVMGYGETAVLKRLSEPAGDLARFCFKGAVDSITNEPAYKLLLALSLFSTDGSREALGEIAEIEKIVQRDKGLILLENLSLISKSANRFQMLPLTQQYVRAENAWDSDLGELLEANWLKYLTGITMQSGHSHWRWLNFDVLVTEGENILAAIDWALQKDYYHVALDLAPAIYWYLDTVGRWSDAIRYSSEMIDVAQGVSDHYSLTGLFRQLAWIYGQMGDFAEAAAYLRQGSRACDSLQGRHASQAQVPILLTWGQVLRKAGKLDEATEKYEIARVLIEEQQLEGERPETLEFELGKLARDKGDWESARQSFSKIVDWSKNREENNLAFSPDLVMGARGSLAFVLSQLGEYEEAEAECLASMTFGEKRGGRGYYAMLQYRLSLIKEAVGDLEEALVLAESALATCYQLGMKPEIPEFELLVDRLQSAVNETKRTSE